MVEDCENISVELGLFSASILCCNFKCIYSCSLSIIIYYNIQLINVVKALSFL